jgi:hypothetical protein
VSWKRKETGSREQGEKRVKRSMLFPGKKREKIQNMFILLGREGERRGREKEKKRHILHRAERGIYCLT